MSENVIKIKCLDENCKPVKNGDWIDLFTAEDVKLLKFDFYLISLGVAMQLPEGFEAIVVPRSSTYKNWGVLQANSVGVIDNAYCGDDDVWYFPALAMMDTIIPKYTRICQFKIVANQPDWEIEYVDTLNNENRGGFGSTGD